MDETRLQIRLVNRLADVDAEAWNAVANPPSEAYDPFLSWEFLQALEESEAASPATGWSPHHILIEKADQGLCGAMPLYLKSHSQGEYVFDHGWADAFERAGGHYYPKLQACVPFTPATGPRLLARRGTDEATVRAALAASDRFAVFGDVDLGASLVGHRGLAGPEPVVGTTGLALALRLGVALSL